MVHESGIGDRKELQGTVQNGRSLWVERGGRKKFLAKSDCFRQRQLAFWKGGYLYDSLDSVMGQKLKCNVYSAHVTDQALY